MAERRQRVLVFPCGSEIGLEIARSVSSSTHFELVGGTSVADHGLHAFSEVVQGMPFVGDDQFIPLLEKTITEHRIDIVYPAHDDVVVAVAAALENDQLSARAVVPSASTATTTRSKSLTYEALRDVVEVPRVFESPADVPVDLLPIFVKPDRGNGSKGAVLVDSPAQLDSLRDRIETLMISEYLPGAEFTVDCFTDRHGVLRYSRGRSRERIVNGIAAKSRWVDDVRFTDFAGAINGRLDLRGGWFFQVKERASGDLVLMEVGPRIGGTMGLSRCSGVNLPLLSLFDIGGTDIQIRPTKDVVEVDRAFESSYEMDLDYDHMYIDLDDLILVRDRVNTLALRVIFESINRDIKIHLLTKHEGDLQATLERHRIAGIFDEIVHIPRNDEKWKYIFESRAVFIDDSFAEREAVQINCRIPVFDVHSLEALLESRAR